MVDHISIDVYLSLLGFKIHLLHPARQYHEILHQVFGYECPVWIKRC